MNDSLRSRVEIFADLMVHIDDPFARRDAVFASAGIDEASYRGLVDGWRARFDRDETGKLASRFAEAYAEARVKRHDADEGAREPITESGTPPISMEAPIAAQAPITPSEPPPIAPLPTFVPPVVAPSTPMTHAEKRALFAGTMDISAAVPRASLPFVPQAATAAPPTEPRRPALPTGTSDISAFIPRGPLPFSDAGTQADPPTAALPSEPAAPSSTGVRRPPQAFAGTADISAFIPRPATPFAASPPASAPTAPRKRLIRFDPQTGQPLPTPIWVDLPPEPEGPKK